jgi:hypothetical protein
VRALKNWESLGAVDMINHLHLPSVKNQNNLYESIEKKNILQDPLNKNFTKIGKTIKRVGDNYLWIYVKSEDPKKNALAFDDKNKSHITEIDYEKMTERNIYNIIETIFEAMKWDLSVIMPQKVRKPRKNAKIALDLSTGTLQEGDNKLKQGIIPVKKKTKSANLTQPIETK